MDNERSIEPTHVIDFKSKITCVEFSPFEWSHNLVCVAIRNEISVGLVKFQEENADQETELEFHLLREFYQDSRIDAVAWSPETSLGVLPKLVKFAAARRDYDVHLIVSDLANDDIVHILTGHSNYINAIAFDPNCKTLASGSVDRTVRIWSNAACINIMGFKFPVMALSWHRGEPGQLLIGGMNGILRLVEAMTGHCLITLRTLEVPLSDAHWAPSNSDVVAAVGGTNLVLWDTKHPSLQENLRVLYGEAAVRLRVCPTNHQVVATVGEPRHELKVTHLQAKSPLMTAPCTVYAGLCWHLKLPYVCVGVDRRLCLWKVGTK